MRDQTRIVVTIDNNQKGHRLTFQQFGSASKFVKVTARHLRETAYFKHEHHCVIIPKTSHADQDMPSPYLTRPFEFVNNINFDVAKDPVNFKCLSKFLPTEVKVIRVRKHTEHIHYCNVLSSVFKHMTGHDSIQKSSNVGRTCLKFTKLYFVTPLF